MHNSRICSSSSSRRKLAAGFPCLRTVGSREAPRLRSAATLNRIHVLIIDTRVYVYSKRRGCCTPGERERTRRLAIDFRAREKLDGARKQKPEVTGGWLLVAVRYVCVLAIFSLLLLGRRSSLTLSFLAMSFNKMKTHINGLEKCFPNRLLIYI